MSKKIVILDGHSLNPGDLSWEAIGELGDLIVYERTSVEEVMERIRDASYIFTNKTQITRDLIEAASKLEFIGVLATGYNVVDLAAAKEKGIPVCNIPNYSTEAVAQLVFALLLEIANQVGHHNQAVKEGRWSASPDFCFWDFPLMELQGKSMGFIGFGHTGQASARLARAFGLKTLAYNRSESESGRALADYVTLEELLAKADIISLHLPLFPETQNLINKETIARMKDEAIVINTARGPLVNEQDMAEALNSGKLAYFAADVVSHEPIEPTNPLLKAKNTILTPHIAWATKEARQRLMTIATDNLKNYQAGRPSNVVNS